MEQINWFPGHMAKAMRDLKAKQDLVDCFIVVLDARLPLSSYNDQFDSISPQKPRLFVFSRADLIKPEKLKPFLKAFNNPLDKCVVVNLKAAGAYQKIYQTLKKIEQAKKINDQKKGFVRPWLRCLVVGLPNVGKSTLINLLAQKKKVAVANQAGTTRQNQWINAGTIQLLDTPGILMPKLFDQILALKLVVCNLIKQQVISDQNFYYQVMDLLATISPQTLKQLGLLYGQTEVEKYNQLVYFAQKHHLLLAKKQPDLVRALSLIRQKILNLKGIIWDVI